MGKEEHPAPRLEEAEYGHLLKEVSQVLEHARRSAARTINTLLTVTYWEVGRRLVEFEQKGEKKAAYGTALLRQLSRDLTHRLGRGFSEENLRLMRLFYLQYRDRISQTLSGESPDSSLLSKSQTVSGKFPLSWSHYVRLLVLDDPHKRIFYEEEARRAGWSVRQLDRQIGYCAYSCGNRR